MKNRSIIIYLALFLTSCHKYLDVTPKGIVIPSTTAQYEGMLNSPALTQTFPKELLFDRRCVFAGRCNQHHHNKQCLFMAAIYQCRR